MLFLIEVVVSLALFSFCVVSSISKDIGAWAEDMPPRLRDRFFELGIAEEERSKTRLWIAKSFTSALVALFFAATGFFINGISTFLDGAIFAYLVWSILAIFDFIVIDVIWFSHSKKIRPKGTEDMDSAWKDYSFHLRKSGEGLLIGLPMSLFSGLITIALSSLS